MTVPIKYRISSVATKPSADSVKGVPLTSLEIDGNFRSIKDAIEALEPISSILEVPDYIGQLSIVDNAAYIATGISNVSDWKQITS